LLIAKSRNTDVPPTRVFSEKRLQTTENKGRGLVKEDKEAASFCKQKSWRICRSERLSVGNDGGYTYISVATESLRKLLRTGEISAPRDADDGVSCLVRAEKRVGSGQCVKSQSSADECPDRVLAVRFGRPWGRVARGIRISKEVYIERSNFGVEWGFLSLNGAEAL